MSESDNESARKNIQGYQKNISKDLLIMKKYYFLISLVQLLYFSRNEIPFSTIYGKKSQIGQAALNKDLDGGGNQEID